MDSTILLEINDLISGGLAFLLIPTINAIIGFIRPFVKDTRWYPIFSVILGIGGGLLLAGLSVVAAVGGLIIGLTSTGLYENVKTVALAKKES